MSPNLNALLSEIRACRHCVDDMPNTPNPILQASGSARVLVVGQAPGNLADQTGMPFNDPSGVRLREWMGVTPDTFYDPTRIAIIPMGFCFPGYDAKGGDLPPMKACAGLWREKLLSHLPHIRVTILVGFHAQKWHLRANVARNLTETVRKWKDFAASGIYVTPHPSWRNNGWLKKHQWFEMELLPELRRSVQSCL